MLTIEPRGPRMASPLSGLSVALHCSGTVADKPKKHASRSVGVRRSSIEISRRLRHGLKHRARVPGLPPQLQSEIARNDAGRDIAGAARDCAAGMAGGARVVEIGDR